MKCRKHTMYLGIMTPRVDCKSCWLIYSKSLQKRLNFACGKIQELEDNENDNRRE